MNTKNTAAVTLAVLYWSLNKLLRRPVISPVLLALYVEDTEGE